MRFVRAFLLLFFAACSADVSDEDFARAAAQRIRERPFLAEARIERGSRDEFLAARSAEGAQEPAEEVARLHATLGRLGFFPPSFDVRTVAAATAHLNGGGYYSSDDKKITVFGQVERHVLVHELVHALQDQHFDLKTFRDQARTTDETMARRAVIEGDATVCHFWFSYEERNQRPLDGLRSLITPERMRAWRDEMFDTVDVPRVFAGYHTFIYPYGALMTARAAGIREAPPRFSGRSSDQLFQTPPTTTDEVMRGGLGLPADPPSDVGLGELPPDLMRRYEVVGADRFGAWFTSLVAYGDGLGSGRLPSYTPFVPYTPFVAVDALAWDGDQVVMLVAKGDPAPPEEAIPIAVVWTTSWDDAASAQVFADTLHRIHAAEAEPTEILREDRKVVLAKGAIPIEDVRALAAAALVGPGTKRELPIRGIVRLPPLE
jgi:hypothetical protein